MSEAWRFDELHPDAYRTLVEGVPAILYIDRPDEASTNLYTSPQVEAVLGYTLQEWVGDPELWVRALHPEDRDRVLEAHRESNERGERFLLEYRLQGKDGRWRWFRDEASPMRDDQGTLVFWRGVMLDITDRREAEDRLRWSLDVLRTTLQQRRDLAQRVQHAQEAERRRIAADLHDDPIQVMSAVDMRLQMLAAYPDRVDVAEIQALEADVRAAIERMRSMLFELRPVALEREGLVAALTLYAEHAAATTGWTWEVDGRIDDEPDEDMQALLYRIAQEAIQNARKHADATRVRVDVATAGDGVRLRVHDDGSGFDADLATTPEPGHLGLTAMQESAELAGGWIRVSSAPGSGTTVDCWLPLAATDPA
jgi:PAS domain S-box-containing protein